MHTRLLQTTIGVVICGLLNCAIATNIDSPSTSFQ